MRHDGRGAGGSEYDPSRDLENICSDLRLYRNHVMRAWRTCNEHWIFKHNYRNRLLNPLNVECKAQLSYDTDNTNLDFKSQQKNTYKKL